MTERLAVLLIDSVNVPSRAHYLPAFSRLGAYPRAALDELTARRHAVFEYWAHEASFLPVRLHPHLRWRMAAAEAHAWGNMVRLQREQPGFVAEVLDRVRVEGPLKASDLLEEKRERSGDMWDWLRARWRSSGSSSPERSPRRTGRRASRRSTTSPSGCCRLPSWRHPPPIPPTPSASSSGPPPGRSGWPPNGTCATTSASGRRPRGRRSRNFP